MITGQNQISHPSSPSGPPPSEISSEGFYTDESEEDGGGAIEDANLPGSLAELRTQNIEFSKHDEAELPSRIERIWYINPYGQEIRPPANPKVLASINQAEAVVYSIGSLYTRYLSSPNPRKREVSDHRHSLAPILTLRGVARAIKSTPPHTPKILILNGSHDRETSPSSQTFTASDFVRAIVSACTATAAAASAKEQQEEEAWKGYVTHIIYLEGNGAPGVDAAALKAAAGIEAIRVYGRRHPGGAGKGMLYDSAPLLQALAVILGKNSRSRKPETRRNTFDGGVQVQ